MDPNEGSAAADLAPEVQPPADVDEAASSAAGSEVRRRRRRAGGGVKAAPSSVVEGEIPAPASEPPPPASADSGAGVGAPSHAVAPSDGSAAASAAAPPPIESATLPVTRAVGGFRPQGRSTAASSRVSALVEDTDVVGEIVSTSQNGGRFMSGAVESGDSVLKRTIFKEMPIDGVFKQLSESEAAQRSVAESVEVSAQCTPESVFCEVEALVSSAFVFVQGMLAGVGLVLLLIGFGNSTTQTLAAISSISVQLERAMFFLALTSAAGSINKLCVDNACRFNGSRALVFYDVLTVCLYVTCVIFTILAAPVDEIMFHSSLRVPDWYIAPLPPAFLAAFDNWKRYNGVRACTAIAGWLMLSFQTRSYASTLPRGDSAVQSAHKN